MMIAYSIFLLFLPIPVMFVQWHIDKVIKTNYPIRPWKQDQLSGNSRAYSEHVRYHALYTMIAVYVSLIDRNIGMLLLAFSLLMPFIIEGVDIYVRHKTGSKVDIRERVAGALAPLPLFILNFF